MQRIVNPPVRSGSHKFNDGWLSVERSMYDRIDRYETENHHVFAGGWLEVRKYGWSQPIENIWSTEKRCYLISMSLGGHETSVVKNLKTGQCGQLESSGRIFLVPPEQTMQCQSQRGQVRSMRCMLEASLVESFLDTVPMWAKALLIAGASVREVAASIGYATPSSFTSAFRRATGVLPSEVAALNRGGATFG